MVVVVGRGVVSSLGRELENFILGPIWSWAYLELSPLGLEVGLNFSPTLQSGS
jgi:hypothetical protein